MLNRVLFHPFTIFTVTVITILVTLSLRRTIGEFKQANQSLEQTKQQVEKLKEQQSQLQAKVTQSTSAFTKEKIARDELLLQVEGEQILQVILPTPTPTTTQIETQKQPLDQWLNLIW